MINKFSKILENRGNIYQKGTPFSNGHRSRTNGDGFLLDKHLMIDIDKIIVDTNDKIVGIIEKKVQLPGSESQFKNILDPAVTNPQKLGLLELSKRLNCKLFVYVEKLEKYFLLKQDFSTREFTEVIMNQSLAEKNLRIINTDNIIFIEFRKFGRTIVVKGIAERADSNLILYNFINQISTACGNVPIFQVNDSGDEITFRIKGKLIGKVKSVLYPKSVDNVLRMKLENDWENIYRQLNLWN